MDNNDCSYFVSSLVPTEFISIKTSPLLGSYSKFWAICQTETAL